MADGAGLAIYLYGFGAFCAGIPLIVINLVSVVILAVFFDHSLLSIWLASNTGFTLGVCGIGMLAIACSGMKGNPSKEDLGSMCLCTICTPCILIISKVGFNIWGIVELVNYVHKWNALSIYSVCIIILQLIIYAIFVGIFLYRGGESVVEKIKTTNVNA